MGGDQLSEAVPEVGAVTLIVKAGSADVTWPSLTLMTIPGFVVAAAGAVPDNCPDAILKLAQVGLPWMLKDNASPLESVAVGRKL